MQSCMEEKCIFHDKTCAGGWVVARRRIISIIAVFTLGLCCGRRCSTFRLFLAVPAERPGSKGIVSGYCPKSRKWLTRSGILTECVAGHGYMPARRSYIVCYLLHAMPRQRSPPHGHPPFERLHRQRHITTSQQQQGLNNDIFAETTESVPSFAIRSVPGMAVRRMSPPVVPGF